MAWVFLFFVLMNFLERFFFCFAGESLFKQKMFEVKRYFLILGLFCRACRSFFARSDKRTAIHVQYPEAQYSRYQPKMFETILELKRSFNGSE